MPTAYVFTAHGGPEVTPFLHALASNTGAVRLYESMGFRLRRSITFSAVSVPAGAATPPVEERAAGARAGRRK